jgi:hypothetical protein
MQAREASVSAALQFDIVRCYLGPKWVTQGPNLSSESNTNTALNHSTVVTWFMSRK